MILIALALSALTVEDRWIHVGGSPNRYEDYVDRESIKRSGDKVTLWTRRNFAEGAGTAWNELELDCRMMTETILAFVRDDRGTISHNVDRPHRAAVPIPVNSVEEKIFDIACR